MALYLLAATYAAAILWWLAAMCRSKYNQGLLASGLCSVLALGMFLVATGGEGTYIVVSFMMVMIMTFVYTATTLRLFLLSIDELPVSQNNEPALEGEAEAPSPAGRRPYQAQHAA